MQPTNTPVNTQSASMQQTMKRIQRPINCLADEDRNIRKSGLTSLKNQLTTSFNGINNNIHLKSLFTQSKLPSLLSRTYNDKIQINRQLALQITLITVDKLREQGKNIYEMLLPQLIKRVNQVPFPQNSEQLRLIIVRDVYGRLLLHSSDCLIKNIGQLASSVAKCLLDPYDMIKLACCQFINKISKQLRHQIGKHASSMAKALCANLTHQKFKVRKCSLQSIGFLLATESAGSNFDHCKVGLKSALSDKKKQVRQAALQCTAYLLQYLSYKYLKQFQAALIGYLLVGMSDEDESVRLRVIGLLEKCGSKLRQQNQSTQMIDEGTNK